MLLAVKRQIIQKISMKGVKDSVSYQMVPSATESLEGLLRDNPYFQQFSYAPTINDFVDELMILQSLDAVDVAAYLHRMIEPRLTGFKFQQLLYFVYTEYLIQFGVPPFRANLTVCDNGPVEKDVYRLQKWEKHALDDNYHFEEKVLGTPHADLIPFIQKVDGRYGEHLRRASDEEQNLVQRPGSPWSEARKQGQNAPITETAIIARHQFEQL